MGRPNGSILVLGSTLKHIHALACTHAPPIRPQIRTFHTHAADGADLYSFTVHKKGGYARIYDLGGAFGMLLIATVRWYANRRKNTKSTLLPQDTASKSKGKYEVYEKAQVEEPIDM